MTNSLKKTGLSMTAAQSISNMCFQKAEEIDKKISAINNCSKTIMIDGTAHKTIQARFMPDNIIDLILAKAKYHACQAFLMSNIKEKDNLLNDVRNQKPDQSLFPEKPVEPLMESYNFLTKESVDEQWGWDQLTESEANEYLEAEAFAAHIGQFIHKTGKLTQLRNEIANIPDIEWMEVEKDKKTPVTIDIHHNSDNLTSLHEQFAKLHRLYEQKVNYFKAKVKNLVSDKNAEITNENSTIISEIVERNSTKRNQYLAEIGKWNEDVKKIINDFEGKKEKELKSISALKIDVDNRFQPVVDEFLQEAEKGE